MSLIDRHPVVSGGLSCVAATLLVFSAVSLPPAGPPSRLSSSPDLPPWPSQPSAAGISQQVAFQQTLGRAPGHHVNIMWSRPVIV